MDKYDKTKKKFFLSIFFGIIALAGYYLITNESELTPVYLPNQTNKKSYELTNEIAQLDKKEVSDTQNTTTTSQNDALQQHFDYYYQLPSEYNEHVPLLRDLASQCRSITDVGCENLDTTWPLLLGLSENPSETRRYLGIDEIAPKQEQINYIKQIAEDKNIEFVFWNIDPLLNEFEPCDMVLINSVPAYFHVTSLLERCANKMRKYICLTRTNIHWETKDTYQLKEDCRNAIYSYDPAKGGVWPAVEDFLKNHPEWSVMERKFNNNGFIVLKRDPNLPVKEYTYHPDIDYTLKNKMILCTGPSLNRYDRLKTVTEADLRLVPFKKIFVTTNDPKNMSITFLDQKPVMRLNSYTGHQIGCLNCLIGSLKDAVNHPETKDDDIIVFKHESCFINDPYLFKKAVSKILSGYDGVTRAWQHPHSPHGTDGFFLRVGAAKDIVSQLTYVNEFPANAPYCECYFGTYIAEKLNVYSIPYSHLNWKNTQLGFWHVPAANLPGVVYWDKANYSEIYN